MRTEYVKLKVRMERSLQEDAEAVFAAMGLDTTTAVRVFFTKVARTRSFPFRVKAEPEFSPDQDHLGIVPCIPASAFPAKTETVLRRPEHESPV